MRSFDPSPPPGQTPHAYVELGAVWATPSKLGSLPRAGNRLDLLYLWQVDRDLRRTVRGPDSRILTHHRRPHAAAWLSSRVCKAASKPWVRSADAQGSHQPGVSKPDSPIWPGFPNKNRRHGCPPPPTLTGRIVTPAPSGAWVMSPSSTRCSRRVWRSGRRWAKCSPRTSQSSSIAGSRVDAPRRSNPSRRPA